jgi:hypothetical protein
MDSIPFVNFVYYMVSTAIVMFMFGYLAGLER